MSKMFHNGVTKLKHHVVETEPHLPTLHPTCSMEKVHINEDEEKATKTYPKWWEDAKGVIGGITVLLTITAFIIGAHLLNTHHEATTLQNVYNNINSITQTTPNMTAGELQNRLTETYQGTLTVMKTGDGWVLVGNPESNPKCVITATHTGTTLGGGCKIFR